MKRCRWTTFFLFAICWPRCLPILAALASPADAGPAGDSSLLPHVEQLAPGVFAAGFAHRFDSANCGWVVQKDHVVLIDLPRSLPVPDFLSEVARTSGKPVRHLVLTHFRSADAGMVSALVELGVREIFASPATADRLREALPKLTPEQIHSVAERTRLNGTGTGAVLQFLPLDGIVGQTGAVVLLPKQRVLFAGALVVHGPRADLAEADTQRWIATLKELEQLDVQRVVPGFGSWASMGALTRQRRFLSELRRQVAYFIARGRPHSALAGDIRLPDDCFVWMPYDYPTPPDLEHVYGELTVPFAPFGGRDPAISDPRPHALVLIGDEPHEPGHLEDGLRPVFEATGVVAHFTVDVRALSAENLHQVQLLVILRDGLMRPRTSPNSDYVWMTPEQEQAVVQFVERGGGLLNLHNAMGLYPADGPYLRLVGGRYIGHGPLERFRVEVVDPDHPITRGIVAFSVADEQHTPPYDASKVRLLLRNRSDDGKVAAAGWAYEPGRGRVCHLANGHTREVLEHPMVQRLLRNAVGWCLRRDERAVQNRR